MQEILSVLYGFSGLIVISAFLPQILRTWKDQSASESMSVASSLIFTANAMIGFGYASLVNQDPLLMLTVGCATSCSMTLTYLLLRNRYIRPALQARGIRFDSYAFMLNNRSKLVSGAACLALVLLPNVETLHHASYKQMPAIYHYKEDDLKR